jgi:murein L,D-transpeptidase YcbB/YkuD
LALLLTSHPGYAQQTDQQRIDAAVPVPDTTLPPPLTARDIEQAPAGAAAIDTKPIEPKQEAATPAVEPPKAAPVQNATSPAAEPAKPVVSADAALTDKLREFVTGRQLDRIVARKADRAAVEAFYAARNYAPLWIANGAAAARANSAIAYLNDAQAVGLDPNDYPTPDFKAAATSDALAEAELKLTASALTFARHAQTGRIHFTRVAGDITFNPVAPEPADVLAKLAANDDAGKTLDAFNPPMAEFKALKAKLAELRKTGGQVAPKPEEKKVEHVRIPEGKILRPGMKDERVIALRKRLDIPGDKNSSLYDDSVRDAVKAFQLSADLDADGNLGRNTTAALNGGPKSKEQRASHNPIDTIVVNMERWRWFPRDLGAQHVIVNVPDYSLTLWSNSKVYWHTRIVAGKPNHMTPMISAEMKFITVNPTWNVPPSIIENEYLPALQQDPDALDRIGLKVEQNADGTVRIYQPPGAANALGRIRFNFPNKYLVYQHDTPDKHLFARDERAYSHGCMRVQNPFTYAEKLLSLALPNENYTEARIEKMLGSNEININFPKPIWVHLTYQTAFVDQDGKLQLRKDVYGRDAKMISILKGSELKVADIAIDRPPNTSSKPVRMPVGTFGNNRGYSNNGPNFFDWLFNGGRQQEVYRPRGAIGPRADSNGRYYGSWR